MLKRKRMVLVVWAFLLLSSTTEAGQSGGDLQLALQHRLPIHSVSAGNFVQALAQAASQFGIPMGIEWVNSPRDLKPLSFTLREVTVEQVLGSIVSTQPGYGYNSKNGVFHVFPKDMLQDDISFLNLKIKSFQVDNEFVEFAGVRLKATIRHMLYPAMASKAPSGSGGSMATGMGDQRVTFKLRDVRVRDILDKFVLSSGRKIWLVTYPPQDEFTDSGERRVVSIYNENITEEYQPVWDLMVWGFDPADKVFRPEWAPPPKIK
jgi:hypothetical protein